MFARLEMAGIVEVPHKMEKKGIRTVQYSVDK
jgi:hypothetical protein